MRRTIAIAAALTTLVLGACSSGSGSNALDKNPKSTTAPADKASGSEVTVKLFNFSPDPLTVKAGTKVTWTNEDDILHTVTSGKRPTTDGMFDGQLDGKGKTFSFTFDKAGTYSYFCSRHPGPGMTAEIVVQ